MADVAYCMKCREKREFTGSLVTLKNGRPALQGTCPVCGGSLKSRQDRVRAWHGTYAHSSCASYRRRGRDSQRVHDSFTAA